MALTSNEIKDACYRVMTLGKIANWQFKGMPVLQWEFATIADYHRARRDLLAALEPELRMMVKSQGLFRKVSSDVEELDCYGTTFRLICKQKIMTQRGPYGVGDMKFGE